MTTIQDADNKESRAKRVFEKNNGWELSKYGDKHKFTDPRHYVNLKKNKLKEIHAHHIILKL